jgi:hypothetical protein
MSNTDQGARPTTPASIGFALLCFAFAVVAPFIGGYKAGHARADGWGALAAFLPWVFAAAGAAFVGLISTIVGAWRGPRSVATIIAIVISCLFGFGFLALLANLLR